MATEKLPFYPADILLPRDCDLTKWSVVACDQYTSQPAYWQRVADFVGDAPSTLHMILPEAFLQDPDEKIVQLQAAMQAWLDAGHITTLQQSFVYLERRLSGGRIRRGLVGMLDLEAYDWTPGTSAPVRATEHTVPSRIPPRARARRGAPLELPHAILLMDDPENLVFGQLQVLREELTPVYDFELMEGGGHLNGWQVTGAAADAVLQQLARLQAGSDFLFAVGDGNHSLATAKAVYEELKAADPGADFLDHPARYALVELENIHDPALTFSPIHRIYTGPDADLLEAELRDLPHLITSAPVRMVTRSGEETIWLPPGGNHLAVGALQDFLDGFVRMNGGEVDYIHGDDVLRELSAAPNTVGFLLPPLEKSGFFAAIQAGGVLPRKTFSMGEACEKRFYLESRRIQNAAAH